jgi:hypothetical protein
MSLDKFYTNDDIAIECYRKLQEYINISDFNTILEPSAGKGAFFKLLPENTRIGIDLDPQYDGIEQMDFFDFTSFESTKYLVIGNPPFGKISSLAVKFFNRSAEFADIIAFIVPRTFKRVSIQNKLNQQFHLIYNEDLPMTPCCFSPKMSAKCCYQIWKKENIQRELVVYDKIHPDFKFIKHGPKDSNNQPTPPENCDFAIKAYGSNCGVIKDINLELLRPKSWHWIKSNIDIDLLKQRLRELNYSMSRDTVRQDSLGQQELIHLYKLQFN